MLIAVLKALVLYFSVLLAIIFLIGLIGFLIEGIKYDPSNRKVQYCRRIVTMTISF